MCVRAESLQLCPTPCDPMDHGALGSSVHAILQARILEWAAMPSSKGSPQPRIEPRSPTLQADFFFYCVSHQGRPLVQFYYY